MRKLPAVIAVLGLAAVALVGCSSGSGASASCSRPTDTSSATMDLISVSGPTDAKPTVTVHTPLHATSTQFADVKTGKGVVPITTGKQLVVLDVSLTSATTGKTIVTTAYDGSDSTVLSVSQWSKSFPGFRKALQCATAGTRIALAVAPDGIESQAAQSLSLGKDDSVVAVLDVRKVYLAAANGALVYNSGWGLPAVVRAPNGRPGVVVPDSPAPQNLTVQVLKSGDGQKVTGERPVRLHYTVVNWTDKSVASTTWDGDPPSVTLSSMSKGFQDAVKGQRVGSQIMAIVPKADGTQGVDDTQIVVIDILGIDAVGVAASQ
ncbi:MAG: hypothetical protein J0I50_03280 [Microbacterium sp.]|nr:hypothetical protein [Microbacterium sp.]